ncbi:MAG: hypothetical protein OEX12_13520 [Gammaproteobacteria bacterium]|nr:hypothetical protein [Gammaproteobacteria bacterium]
MTKQRWIFVIKIIRKPGVLNSISGVFANWGISLEIAMLNAGDAEGSDGIVILSFSCSPRKRLVLERNVSRLSRIKELYSYPYETEELRMIAACTVNKSCVLKTDEHIAIEEHTRKDDSKLVYLTGTVKDVDAYIIPMQKRKEINEMVRTILTT